MNYAVDMVRNNELCRVIVSESEHQATISYWKLMPPLPFLSQQSVRKANINPAILGPWNVPAPTLLQPLCNKTETQPKPCSNPLPALLQTPCRWHRWQICHRWRWYRWCTLNCEYLREFSKKFEMVLMEYSGDGGNWFMKKTRSKISRDTVPLRRWHIGEVICVRINQKSV